ncbi:MAG: aminotransferase, partial [Acidobacteria bacterium]|nr:aminotransferase [Acidobacteriota bacterium]
IAASPDVVAQCWGLRDYITLSPGKLNDALARLGLKHRDAIIARNTRIIQANLRIASAWIADRPYLSWTPPRGGLLALIKYDRAMPSLELADLLAIEHSVMLAPGSAFGYEHHLRLGIGQKPDVFAEGLRRAGAVLDALPR